MFLGPVVQRTVSLTSLLVFKMLTVLDSQVFLLTNVSSFCKCKYYSHFFSKILAYMPYLNDQSFNNTLANDIVSFEQPGPVWEFRMTPGQPVVFHTYSLF